LRNKLNDVFNFRGVHKSTLQPRYITIVRNQHITFTYELFGPAGVQNGAGIYFRTNFKGNAGRKVGFNRAGKDVDRRPLSSNDQMYPYSPCQLSKAGYRHLYFLSGRHDKIGKFIYYEYNERHIMMSILRVKPPVCKFF